MSIRYDLRQLWETLMKTDEHKTNGSIYKGAIEIWNVLNMRSSLSAPCAYLWTLSLTLVHPLRDVQIHGLLQRYSFCTWALGSTRPRGFILNLCQLTTRCHFSFTPPLWSLSCLRKLRFYIMMAKIECLIIWISMGWRDYWQENCILCSDRSVIQTLWWNARLLLHAPDECVFQFRLLAEELLCVF